ncbi:DUF4391 domain-containing protein [Candidatus Parcubacteria bacterium]|nr:DUF4391 domain-containing protein [Candidatus Parcubacteria bacterium]
MEDKIIKIFNLEKEVVQNRKIKSIFYEHEKFNAEKKRLFDDAVENIKLVGLFNDDTINIPKYKDEEFLYEEIYLIHIELKDKKQYTRVVSVIHEFIENPVILVLSYEKEIQLSGSITRINKKTQEKGITEDLFQTPWISIDDESVKYLDTKKYSYESLKKFYEEYLRVMLCFNLVEIIGEFKYVPKYAILDLRVIIEKYALLKAQIDSLKQNQKQSVGFGDKVEIQEKIIKLQKELEIIKQQVKEL